MSGSVSIARRRDRPRGTIREVQKLGDRLSVFAFAAAVVLAFVGLAFAAGYMIGKLLL